MANNPCFEARTYWCESTIYWSFSCTFQDYVICQCWIPFLKKNPKNKTKTKTNNRHKKPQNHLNTVTPLWNHLSLGLHKKYHATIFIKYKKTIVKITETSHFRILWGTIQHLLKYRLVSPMKESLEYWSRCTKTKFTVWTRTSSAMWSNGDLNKIHEQFSVHFPKSCVLNAQACAVRNSIRAAGKRKWKLTGSPAPSSSICNQFCQSVQ